MILIHGLLNINEKEKARQFNENAHDGKLTDAHFTELLYLSSISISHKHSTHIKQYPFFILQ